MTEKKVKQVKGFVIVEVKGGNYPVVVYTKDEWSYGKGLRNPEWECDSVEEAIEWIG